MPDGSRYAFVDETHLAEITNVEDRIYKGIYQISREDIIALQNNRKQLEQDNLPSNQWTTFSNVNDSGLFQITAQHINELRESTEKLLLSFYTNKEEYFNQDEDGNIINHPDGLKSNWTDSYLESDKFQVKYIHIEDLRHFIQTSLWKETWMKHQDVPYSFTDEITISADGSEPRWYDSNGPILIADNIWSRGVIGIYITGSLDTVHQPIFGMAQAKIDFSKQTSLEGFCEVEVDFNHMRGREYEVNSRAERWSDGKYCKFGSTIQLKVEDVSANMIVHRTVPMPPVPPHVPDFFNVYSTIEVSVFIYITYPYVTFEHHFILKKQGIDWSGLEETITDIDNIGGGSYTSPVITLPSIISGSTCLMEVSWLITSRAYGRLPIDIASFVTGNYFAQISNFKMGKITVLKA
jgi:hypothetical protein